jgi:hypothetical protein
MAWHSDETRKKISETLMGHHITEETRRRMSESHKKNPVSYWKGKSLSDDHKRHIRENAPRGDLNPAKRPEVREKISRALMGRLGPNCGKTFTNKHKKRIGEGNRGKVRSEESKKKISETRRKNGIAKGPRNPAWRGGVSFEPYCPKFNQEFKERVRAFWGYACGNCGKLQEENGKKLHVHHVNYRKDACCDEEVARQFIPLCGFCHGHTNNNRERWGKKLSRLIKKKYGGRCYFHQGEQLAAWGV